MTFGLRCYSPACPCIRPRYSFVFLRPRVRFRFFRPAPYGLGLTFRYGWRHRLRRAPFIPLVHNTCQAHERTRPRPPQSVSRRLLFIPHPDCNLSLGELPTPFPADNRRLPSFRGAWAPSPAVFGASPNTFSLNPRLHSFLNRSSRRDADWKGPRRLRSCFSTAWLKTEG